MAVVETAETVVFVDVGEPGVSALWVNRAQIESVRTGRARTGSLVTTVGGREFFSIRSPREVMEIIVGVKS